MIDDSGVEAMPYSAETIPRVSPCGPDDFVPFVCPVRCSFSAGGFVVKLRPWQNAPSPAPQSSSSSVGTSFSPNARNPLP